MEMGKKADNNMENVKQIRNPQQKRSIEKKERIIDAGMHLFCEKGYYNTNTAEIAKKAGVSTGIVYSYFKNKDDILMEALAKLSDDMHQMIRRALESFDFTNLQKNDTSIESLQIILKEIVDYCVNMHIALSSAHQELNALENNPAVAAFLISFETQTATLIKEVFENAGFSIKNPDEKIHLLFHIVEDYCHETVFHKHTYIDYDIYLNESIQTMIFLLTSDF